MRDHRQLLSAAAAGLLLLSACGKADTPVQQAPVGTAVETQTVVRADMANESLISGQVVADRAVNIVPTVAGEVQSVGVTAGAQVTAGQVLFTIDTSTITSSYGSLQQSYAATKSMTDTAIASARDAVPLARTAVTTAQTNYDNTMALFNIGAASQVQVDQARAQLDQAQNQLSQAQAAVSQAQAQQQAQLAQIQSSMSQISAQASGGTVTAPCAGLVTAVNVTAGSMAGQSGPAVTIAEGGRTRISVQVSEELLGQLHVGDAAKVTVAAVSPEPFTAQIAQIAPAANPQTALYEVRLYTPSDAAYPIGAFADVTFYVNQRPDAVSIPSEAILTDGQTQYVYTVTGDTAARVEIQTGVVGNGVTEVTQGLSGGETLVVKGQSYLSDGAAVRVVSGEAAQ